MMVVVPTAQSGRRLREELAGAGGVLGPRVVTPSFFLESGRTCPVGVELAAWVDVLESVDDWSRFSGAFPQEPGEGESPGWALPLARSLVGLRRMLQEAGLTVAMAAGRMAEGIESDRWAALAGLENEVERILRRWGWRSRSVALADDDFAPPPGVDQLVVAGVPDVVPVVVQRWQRMDLPVRVLIGAPGEAGVDAWGRPEEDVWAGRPIPWPGADCGSVQVAADPRQQAEMIVDAVAGSGEASDEVGVGSADEQVASELVRSFGRRGWVVFDPGGAAGEMGLSRWFESWRRWLADPRLELVSDLLARGETGVLVKGRRAQKARILAETRDQWLAERASDVRRLLDGGLIRERAVQQTVELVEALRELENWREQFLRQGFFAAMDRLLPILARTGDRTAEEAEVLADFVDEVRDVGRKSERDAGFWTEVMLASLPEKRGTPPDERVLDILGWLELSFEPGRHLVVAGVNEGLVPARAGGEPWLSEAGRRVLGLVTDAQRAARDAYLLTGLLECRRAGGRVDLVCGKTSSDGDALLPSRLLLASDREELPGRVSTLFRDVEPPDAGLHWKADWKWNPPVLPLPDRISVTAFADYLQCPTRYYLKQVSRMRRPDAGRGEWDARDFGTIAHEILERWGGDEDARDYSKTEALAERLEAEMESVLEEHFGSRMPLAIAIQVEGLRQRLRWFAEVQACERASGWRIAEVEKRVEFPVGDMTVTGKVDRIDRHPDGRWRVFDYKTGMGKKVELAHRSKVTAATRVPPHMEDDKRIFAEGEDSKGKPLRMLWRNLQLPLYAAGLAGVEGIPEVGYFFVGPSQDDVRVEQWNGFLQEDLESAVRCAELVVERVQAKQFWPPAERVTHDDFSELGMGRDLAGALSEPGKWRP